MAQLFLHLITFRWKPDASPVAVDRLRQRLDDYGRSAPGVRMFACGPDLGVVEGNADFGIVASFDSESDFHAYRNAPEHTVLVQEQLLPLLDSRSAVQLSYRDGGAP